MSADPRLRRTVSAAVPTPPPPPPPPPESRPDSTTMGLDGASDEPGPALEDAGADPFNLKFCTVCASNQNRSMEAHLQLSTTGRLPTISFGTGSQVRLPGPSLTQPNVYPFNTVPYGTMQSDLTSKDPRLYRANGILAMLDRNKNVKHVPERWHDWVIGAPRLLPATRGDKGAKGVEGGVVDVVITCEERCWDAVVEDLLNRGGTLNRPVHVFNVDIRDNHEEALVGGKAILDLAESLNTAAREERERSGSQGWEEGGGKAREGFDEKVPAILADWQERWPGLPALWTLAWF